MLVWGLFLMFFLGVDGFESVFFFLDVFYTFVAFYDGFVDGFHPPSPFFLCFFSDFGVFPCVFHVFSMLYKYTYNWFSQLPP